MVIQDSGGEKLEEGSRRFVHPWTSQAKQHHSHSIYLVVAVKVLLRMLSALSWSWIGPKVVSRELFEKHEKLAPRHGETQNTQLSHIARRQGTRRRRVSRKSGCWTNPVQDEVVAGLTSVIDVGMVTLESKRC
jgi:hypothetical protein